MGGIPVKGLIIVMTTIVCQKNPGFGIKISSPSYLSEVFAVMSVVVMEVEMDGFPEVFQVTLP